MDLQIVLLASWIGLGLALTFRREIRFTQVTAHYFNKTFGEVLEYNIRQFHGQHYLTFHSFAYTPTSPTLINLELLKCEEYYLNCVYFHSWTINNYCNAMELHMHLVNVDNGYPKKCPLKGEIFIKNMTLKEDILKTLLSHSIRDRWWDNYWIGRALLMIDDKNVYFMSEMKFYFLSYVQKPRNKNHF